MWIAGFLLWTQTRQQWTVNKNSKSPAKQLQEPRLRYVVLNFLHFHQNWHPKQGCQLRSLIVLDSESMFCMSYCTSSFICLLLFLVTIVGTSGRQPTKMSPFFYFSLFVFLLNIPNSIILQLNYAELVDRSRVKSLIPIILTELILYEDGQ